MLPISGLFSDKMKLFVKGRKHIFKTLQKNISPEDRVIWFHAASLGEYEQAVPIINRIKQSYPSYKILVTFFSPSGYEVKKNSQLVDLITYLPLDTPTKVRRFLDLAHPELALFIKYEFWPNFLSELKTRDIPTLLISGAFRNDQLFFKPYGKWMLKYLKTFEHFFLQNQSSETLLQSIGFKNTSVSGDTRFDRVASQLLQNNNLDFVSEFKGHRPCIVIGSSWPEDEALLYPYINENKTHTRYIIAPHTIKPSRITEIQNSLQVPSVLYSQRQGKDLSQFKVLIIDTIGLLTKVYSYADIAYVGGAAGNTGLHNILEPATFGVPVIIGANYDRFPEASALQMRKGLFSVDSKAQLYDTLEKLLNNRAYRLKTGRISRDFIQENTGATDMVMSYIESRCPETKR